jgi:hypothetical protein
MMSKITTEADTSEEVWDCQFITDDESLPKSVRYNQLAYERKMEQQLLAEAQPLTQKSKSEQPITQRAIPKR